MISKAEKIPLRNFELSVHDQDLTDVTMTADACGITRDCFITVSEKPLNQVRYFLSILLMKFVDLDIFFSV